MKGLFFAIFVLMMSIETRAQETIPLYPGTIPNSRPGPDKEISTINSDHLLIISQVSRPTLTIFPADKKNQSGAAVIIVPGGGYHLVAANHEGYEVARAFNRMGVTAFVLKYRIPDDSTMIRKEIGPWQDAQRAIQYVRQEAARWSIDPARIGIMGFSAGGHLASTAGTHYNTPVIENPENTSLRPDFMILIYPVISFSDSIGHIGSRNNLLGEKPSAEKIRYYSNEWQVGPQTPPAFLVHAQDDPAVPVANSLVFCEALKKNNVSCEIYLYEKGGHGFGLVNPTSPVKWMDLVRAWMQQNGWIKP